MKRWRKEREKHGLTVAMEVRGKGKEEGKEEQQQQEEECSRSGGSIEQLSSSSLPTTSQQLGGGSEPRVGFSEIEMTNTTRRLCLYGDDLTTSISSLDNLKFQTTVDELQWS